MEKLFFFIALIFLFIQVDAAIYCNKDSDCKQNFRCSYTQCKCPENLFYNVLEDYCDNYSNAAGSYCKFDDQCKYLATHETMRMLCKGTQCACPINAHVNGTKCYRNQRLTEECRVDEECSYKNPHTHCISNICACLPGYLPHPTENICVAATIKPGDTCRDSNECSTFLGDNSYCDQGKCICREGSHFAKNDGKCLQNKGLGDRCGSKEECYLKGDGEHQHVDCLSGLCSCESGFISTNDNTGCKNGASSLIPLIFLIFSSLISLKL